MREYYGTLRIGEAIALVERLWMEDGMIKVRAAFDGSARHEAGPVTMFDPAGRQVASGQRVSLSDYCRGLRLYPGDSIVVTWELTVSDVSGVKQHAL